jgi:hypothetical protein
MRSWHSAGGEQWFPSEPPQTRHRPHSELTIFRPAGSGPISYACSSFRVFFKAIARARSRDSSCRSGRRARPGDEQDTVLNGALLLRRKDASRGGKPRGKCQLRFRVRCGPLSGSSSGCPSRSRLILYVSYRFARREVEVRLTPRTVEVFLKGERDRAQRLSAISVRREDQ